MVVLVVITALVAAVASSLMTVWLVARYGRRRLVAALRGDLEGAVGELLPRLRAEVESGVTAAAEGALPEIRAAVADGVRAGADEVLPRLRAEVSEGLRQGVVDSVTPEGLGRMGEEIARRGASVVEAGLDRLLGPRRDRDDDP